MSCVQPSCTHIAWIIKWRRRARARVRDAEKSKMTRTTALWRSLKGLLVGASFSFIWSGPSGRASQRQHTRKMMKCLVHLATRVTLSLSLSRSRIRDARLDQQPIIFLTAIAASALLMCVVCDSCCTPRYMMRNWHSAHCAFDGGQLTL